MWRTVICACCVLVATQFAAAQSVDRVRLKNGASESGEITKVTPVGVTLKRGTSEKEIPITDLKSIVFADEPAELTQARLNASNNAYQQALDTLQRINVSQFTNPYVQQDLAFYKAFCDAKLALLGERPVNEAGSALNTFVSKNRQSYHFLEATELLGDLLVAAGRHDAAQAQYETIAKAPWPAYQKRASVLVGNALLDQKKYVEATVAFDSALGVADDSDAGKAQSQAAELGKAVALAAQGKVEEGLKAVEQVIRDADPENSQLLASAYNALGACHLQAGNSKDALFAYLHTDLLYKQAGTQHAEALSHLATLWETVGQEAEARAARALLKERYPGTRWARETGE